MLDGVRTGRLSLLHEVDNKEKSEPHNIDKVPVVRDHNGTGRFVMAEAFSDVGATNNQEESHQTGGHVESVETCGDVEGRTICED